MELVTLAHATLNRIGSISGFQSGMGRRKGVYCVREIADGSIESLRELILTIAEEHGEARETLRSMWQEHNWSSPSHPNAIAFNIQARSTFYGDPYAICYAHPALKIGDRYFKLDEVECSTSTPFD